MKKQPKPSKRSAARLAAVQAIYSLDYKNDSNIDEIIMDFIERKIGGQAIINEDPDLQTEDYVDLIDVDKQLMSSIIRGVYDDLGLLNETIKKALKDEVSIERVEKTLKSILLCGAWELYKNKSVPTAVVINEYVDLAHAFYDNAEPKIANAILDKISKAYRE